ncbi:MAG: hypothetical protein M1819_005683 [Sarea resinae]|nr:MAG: hypothetical protein M1819_005683 [Sarea resinae]
MGADDWQEESLIELEPSPVDDPVDLEKDGYFPSESSPSPPQPVARSTTLGLHGHSAVYYLSRIQRYSSYAFGVFLSFHIANTSLLPLASRSISASDDYLLLTRPYYQSPLVEPVVVILPLLAHIGSGVALRVYRRRQLAKRYGADTRADRRKLAYPKLSGTSILGFALVPMLAGHALLTRVLPLWVDGDSSGIGLSFVSHGFAKHRAISFTAFSLLIATASWHIVWGSAKWLNLSPSQVTEGGADAALQRKRRWYAVNFVSVAVAGLWMAGGLGVIGTAGEIRGWVGRHYDELYRQIPFFGRWA